jgi:hypothetical protein
MATPLCEKCGRRDLVTYQFVGTRAISWSDAAVPAWRSGKKRWVLSVAGKRLTVWFFGTYIRNNSWRFK